ncbi:MAG: TetR/AcrR family transcriptional regulator [Chloroflexi bacterium]|nr:TetR/AcrR family transcriptional regulator [Chloroflexota bacterium]
MPKAFTEHEKEWIGARLLEAGYKQFSAYGLKKANVEELAKAAGISKGAFYLFYESKEALFMDVVEGAEKHFRQELLAVIDQPGPSPRARLLAVFKKAFSLWKTIPVLQFFTQGDYELLFRRLPADKFEEHLASDRRFFEELVTRCQQAGIPIQAPAEEINNLMYLILLASLNQEGFGPGYLASSMDVLLELVAAFCLGEVTIQPAQALTVTKDNDDEPGY